MKRGSGFTLIELMVTIAVVAVLATVALPGFRVFVQENRVTTQTNEVVTMLNFARSEAARRGTDIRVELTAGNDGGWVAQSMIEDTEELLRETDRSGGQMIFNDGEDLSILFNNRGFADDGPFDLTLEAIGCRGEQQRLISVLATGRVSTERRACGNGDEE